MKNIFITGGAGYAGSRLVEHLTQTNNVTVYDTFYFGKDHLEHLGNKVKLIQGDIRDDIMNFLSSIGYKVKRIGG